MPAAASVTVSFDAVCHAVGYRPVPARHRRHRVDARGDDDARRRGPDRRRRRPDHHTLADTGAAGTAAGPPAVNGAALAPYGAEPAFLAGVTAGGVTTVASDASKGYPSTPTSITSPLLPAGAAFVMGAVRAVPRYPSNVYYNVSRQGQQLDEYNWIYVAPPGGACVPIAGVTTCRAAGATWAEYVASETQVMFRHLDGNDPRPHYFHQSNLADYNPALPDAHADQGGILYPVIDALLARYDAAFDRAARRSCSSPRRRSRTRSRARRPGRAAPPASAPGCRTGAYTSRNTVPCRRAADRGRGRASRTAASARAGSRSPRAEQVLRPRGAGRHEPPVVSGTPRVGETLEATVGAWTGASGSPTAANGSAVPRAA